MLLKEGWAWQQGSWKTLTWRSLLRAVRSIDSPSRYIEPDHWIRSRQTEPFSETDVNLEVLTVARDTNAKKLGVQYLSFSLTKSLLSGSPRAPVAVQLLLLAPLSPILPQTIRLS